MEKIGRYNITGELGRGAMGIVYRALDPAIGRTVAIKVIKLGEFTDPSERTRLRDRLFREAQSAGVLSHPNIVTIYDMDEEGGVAFIAMEFVDGPTLDHRLSQEAPSRELVISILRQTAGALDYAHSKGIIHRDIKPANIMLHEKNSVKITDFGVARIQSQQMTQAGLMVGTPNYMSPEQIQGQPVEGRSDQFSLGVIAYELLTGERPFAGESLATVVFKIMNEEPLPAQRLNPTLGWAAESVIKRALAKHASDRFPTCSEFVTALETACNTSPDWKPLAPGAGSELPTIVEATRRPEPPPPPPPPPKPVEMPPASAPRRLDEEDERRPKKRHPVLRALWALLLFVAVAGLGLAAFWWGLKPYLDSRNTTANLPSAVTPEAPQPSTAAEEKPSPVNPAKPVPPAPAKEPPVVTPGAAGPGTVTPPAPKPAQPATKEVKFITSPGGATVTTSDGQNCSAPCSLTLPAGRYSATATLDGYRRAMKMFETKLDDEVVLSLEKATGTLAVRSTPVGATISIDGTARSETTPAMMQLAPGKYRLDVAKEGFTPYSEEVEVKDSVITNVEVNWGSK